MRHPAIELPYSAAGILGALAVQVCAFLAALLFASAIHKLVQRARSRRAAQSLAGLGATTAAIAVVGAAAVEAIAATALLMPSERVAGALIAAGVWGGYFVALWRMVATGREDVDCGCSFGAARHAPGASRLRRTGGLAVIALLAAAAARAGGARGTVAFGEAATAVCAALALLALYLSFDQAAGLRAPGSRVMQ